MGEAVTLDVASPIEIPPEPEDEEPAVPGPIELTNPDHEARKANGPLMVRWAPETRAMLVMEFIAANNLFAALNTFLRKKIR